MSHNYEDNHDGNDVQELKDAQKKNKSGIRASMAIFDNRITPEIRSNAARRAVELREEFDKLSQ